MTPEDAAKFKSLLELFPEWYHIKQTGEQRVPRGKYAERIIIQSRRGGNEWSPSHLVTQFEVYY